MRRNAQSTPVRKRRSDARGSAGDHFMIPEKVVLQSTAWVVFDSLWKHLFPEVVLELQSSKSVSLIRGMSPSWELKVQGFNWCPQDPAWPHCTVPKAGDLVLVLGETFETPEGESHVARKTLVAVVELTAAQTLKLAEVRHSAEVMRTWREGRPEQA